MSEREYSDGELAPLQRWLQTAITHGAGVIPGIAAADAAVGRTPDAAALVAPSRTLVAEERVAIYWRSYHARLVHCFESIFPCLRHALGDELFERFMLDYLHQHPPTSYSIDHLADGFPVHLERTRPDAPGARETWPDFIIELATLELAVLAVFDGPGTEGRAVPAADDVAALSQADVARARVTCSPALRIFHVRYPVHRYLHDVRAGRMPVLPAPRAASVALVRSGFRLRTHELSAAAASVLERCDGSTTLRDAATAVGLGMLADDREAAPLRAWLADWASCGIVAAIDGVG